MAGDKDKTTLLSMMSAGGDLSRSRLNNTTRTVLSKTPDRRGPDTS